MITRFLGRVFSGQLFKPPQPKIIPFGSHGIARDSISACALRVTQTLQRHEFSAFVVGGAVRDLLLGRHPKDYDVATDATPEEVRALFRRSRVIWRRFRIVHVMCGPEMVEVSTFRGANPTEAADGRVADEHGRILRDNVFGTQEQDATRRDFSINALFYDPATQEIWDYHNGVADLRRRRLRMIGEPEARYREDPVRMLRAVRLAASTGLEIDPGARKPLRRLAPLLGNVPAARLMDELLKLLMSGHAAAGISQLRREGLQHGVLPLLDRVMAERAGERLVVVALEATDRRVASGKPVSPAFLFAALLGMGRSMAIEKEDSNLEGLLVSPAPRESVFLGKLFTNLGFTFLVELVILPLFIVLLQLRPAGGTALLILGALLGTLGIVTVGTLFAAMAVLGALGGRRPKQARRLAEHGEGEQQVRALLADRPTLLANYLSAAVAVAILAKLGFSVVAATGRPEEGEYLKKLGAATILV